MNRKMRFCHQVWLVAFSVAAALAAGAGALAQTVEFFPVSELKVGMKGYARTVVQGTQIETFEVEVLGILPDAAPSGDLVIIRASGSVIDRTGGIASGMSGSPVYIDGRLLGAIGYGFSLSDHRIALVTPIEDMYRVLERIPEAQRTRVSQLPAVIRLDAPLAEEIGATAVAVAPDEGTALAWQAVLGPDVAVAAPVRTPLMVTGLSNRAMERLAAALAGYDVVPVQSGGAPAGAGDPEFEPGAAIGVQLARGDVNITGIGTVTHVDGDGFLAFGHSFFNLGDVDFIATKAYIHLTVQSMEFPFKLGAPLAPVGRLLQDRSAGIAGTMQSQADTIPVQINVFDRDANRRRTFRVDIVRSDELTTSVAAVVALEAIDRTIDRLGSGTARVIMQINGDGLPKRIVRDNMYYSHTDIAATALTEFLTGLEAVVSNEFERVRISNIRLDVDVEKERWTARIVEAVPRQSTARPGEYVDVEVTLRPYRGPEEVKVLRLHIPEDVQPGEVTVTARSGGFGYFRLPDDYVPTGVEEPADGQEEGPVDEGDVPSIHSLEALLDVFMNREKNNEVVVEFFPYYQNAFDPFAGGNGGESYSGTSRYLTPIQANLSTRYVIQGSDTFTLSILPPDWAPAAGGEGRPGEAAPADEDRSEVPQTPGPNDAPLTYGAPAGLSRPDGVYGSVQPRGAVLQAHRRA